MWITKQRWESLYFLHFGGNAEFIRRVLPAQLELDESQGLGILSIVPFRMTKVQFPFLPALPGVSNLWELNLRTYVKYKGQSGIYFFTLESDNPLATWVANRFFHLPYRNAKMRAVHSASRLEFQHSRDMLKCRIDVLNTKEVVESSTALSAWATNRYALFNVFKNRVYRGVVEHAPWSLVDATVAQCDGNFLEQVPGAASFSLMGASYSSQIDVSFKPFEKLE
jgi:uncharacterized protein YqjF (DUF2071 family)